jgi:hypothetical protein
MSTISLLNLRTRARDRANHENSTFITDSIYNTYINYSISDLRDIMASKVGEDYFATSFSTTITAGQDTVPLPADFYKLLWVEVQRDTNRWTKIRRFEVSEQNYYVTALAYPLTGLTYRLRANTLWLSPPGASAGLTIRLWYVPVQPPLTLDTDTMDGLNGWDEYVVLLTARKALVKEEQDVSDLDAELMVFKQRLESMAPNRDQAQPMRIYDNDRIYDLEWNEL